MDNSDLINFDDSLVFGREGEDILKRYLIQELCNVHQDKQINFKDVTQNGVCQIDFIMADFYKYGWH